MAERYAMNVHVTIKPIPDDIFYRFHGSGVRWLRQIEIHMTLYAHSQITSTLFNFCFVLFLVRTRSSGVRSVLSVRLDGCCGISSDPITLYVFIPLYVW